MLVLSQIDSIVSCNDASSSNKRRLIMNSNIVINLPLGRERIYENTWNVQVSCDERVFCGKITFFLESHKFF